MTGSSSGDRAGSVLTGIARHARGRGIAVIEGQRALTYAELDERTDALAAYLRAGGVQRDDVVGVHLGRSAASIVGALAVMKASGAYLPIDPAQPRERSRFELRDAGARAVITAPSDTAALDACRIVLLDADGAIVPESGAPPLGGEERASVVPASGDLAYVIYTSGSTGQPKGVEITHGGLANLIAWHCSAFGISAADRASHLCMVGFDAAAAEVWPNLVSGAAVVIVDDPVAKDVPALRDWFVANGVTVACAPTLLAERLIDLDWPAGARLRLLLTGAEALRAFPRAALPFTLVNNYGPTEATVVATSGRVAPRDESEKGSERPSIGRTIANVDVVLVGEHGEPVGEGEPGEIWIGGAGLARGYRNRPDLTAERFVSARFASSVCERFYRTGDIGRFRPDGELIFLGRTDEQIKLRGYRIEPGEIEAALDAHPAVRSSAVIARTFGAEDERLVAYVSGKAPASLVARDIRAFLATRLPAYMIPGSVVALSELPLTPRGKIDRAALKARSDPPPADGYGAETAPRTPTQRRLAEIVAPLFGLGPVSIHEDLIAIGGHLLLLTKLIARIRDAFGVELSFRLAFDSPSIAAIAAEIERAVQRGEAERAPSAIPRRAGGSHR